MISYNKEQLAWDFKDATDEEKAVLLDLGERAWASAIAHALARKWMEQERGELATQPAEPTAHPEESAEIFFPNFNSKIKQ